MLFQRALGAPADHLARVLELFQRFKMLLVDILGRPPILAIQVRVIDAPEENGRNGHGPDGPLGAKPGFDSVDHDGFCLERQNALRLDNSSALRPKLQNRQTTLLTLSFPAVSGREPIHPNFCAGSPANNRGG